MVQPKAAPFVELGGHSFVVKPVPLKQLKALRDLIPALSQSFKDLNTEKAEDVLNAVLDTAFSFPFQFLHIFLPDLTEDVVEEATLPELVDAFSVIANVNRFDVLKNAMQPLTQTVVSATKSSQN